VPSRAAIFVHAAALVAVPLFAQPGPVPPLAADVRLDMRDGKQVIGNTAAIGADTIYLRRFARPTRGEILRAIPLGNVRSYAVGAGWDRWGGAQRGAVIGGALGLVAIGIALNYDATHMDLMVPSIVFAVPAAFVLTGAGAAVGALTAPRRWTETVPLGEPRNAAPEAVRVGMRIDF